MTENKYTTKYLQDAQHLIDFKLTQAGRVSWESPSNIALVKYWGKYGDQLPENPSLSFTLKHSKTVASIDYQLSNGDQPRLGFYFEGKRNEMFEQKISRYIEKISAYMPFVRQLQLKIDSANTFPHSAGIASSASSFSAFALCMCNMERNLFGTLKSDDKFYQKASFLARLGSGSACRSTYGKLALWGKTDSVANSTNELAIPVDNGISTVFKSYYDAILIIDSGQKELSSTGGHALMEKHYYSQNRYNQAQENLKSILAHMQSGNEVGFAQVVENEAMSLHALMMSSVPSVMLLKPNTLVAFERLKEFRQKAKINFTFTLDAGPNIHILYPQSVREQMVHFIESNLLNLCENGRWIDDEVSGGPSQIE
jgi:diphosphomevalonate decarboxylase